MIPDSEHKGNKPFTQTTNDLTQKQPSDQNISSVNSLSSEIKKQTPSSGSPATNTIQGRNVEQTPATGISAHPLAEINGKLYLPDTVPVGIKGEYIGSRRYTVFRSTPHSKYADKKLTKPASSRDECKYKNISAGANGYIQTCTVQNKPAVVKRIYALKIRRNPVIYPDSYGIITEDRVLSGLNHHLKNHSGFEHIVPFYGSGVVNGEPYLLMARADSSLQAHLEKLSAQQQSLPAGQAVSYARQLFSGLSLLAEANLIHQDIKPDNILLKNQHIWIADFGESTSAEGAITHLLDGNVCRLRNGGTTENRPFFSNYEPITPAMDVWSGGLVLMKMLLSKEKYTAFFEQLYAIKVASSNQSDSSETQYKKITELSAEELSIANNKVKEVIHQTLNKQLAGYPHKDRLTSIIATAFHPDYRQRATATDMEQALSLLSDTSGPEKS